MDPGGQLADRVAAGTGTASRPGADRDARGRVGSCPTPRGEEIAASHGGDLMEAIKASVDEARPAPEGKNARRGERLGDAALEAPHG